MEQQNNYSLFADFVNDINVNISEIEKTTSYTLNWTVETIYNQVKNGSIDLAPPFQRRNAWDDTQKSRLIESIILGYPIPAITLAEIQKKGQYVVVDGKQRLLTLIGFIDSSFKSWKKAELRDLHTKKDIKGLTIENIKNNADLNSAFFNSGISCHVIQTKDIDVLYDIFYRLNATSNPLTFQELRQVLYKGKFSEYLIEVTSDMPLKSFQTVMGLKEPDNRLEDVEFLLRMFANHFFKIDYNKGLKDFLDDCMKRINKDWENYEAKVKMAFEGFDRAVKNLEKVFRKNIEDIGKQPDKKLFNKALFEVQIYAFSKVIESSLTDENIKSFKEDFYITYKKPEITKALSLGTNNKTSYFYRFNSFENLVKKHFKTE